jgi:hypothetical protein
MGKSWWPDGGTDVELHRHSCILPSLEGSSGFSSRSVYRIAVDEAANHEALVVAHVRSSLLAVIVARSCQ